MKTFYQSLTGGKDDILTWVVPANATQELVFSYHTTGDASLSLDVVLQSNSTLWLWGVFYVPHKGTVKVTTNIKHQEPNACSKVLIKGVVGGIARFDYEGLITIDASAAKTNAHLESRVLLLGHKAVSVSKPSLEIGTNDVKVSHGATVGQLNKEHLFYLMSRGVAQDIAEKMIVSGFLTAVADQVQDQKTRDKLRYELARELGTGSSKP